MSTKALTGQKVAEAGLKGWAFLVYYGQGELQTRIHTKDFAAGRRVVHAIGKAAEEMKHHADLDLRSSRVDVRLCSDYVGGGVTERDVRLARRISDIAAAAGAELECRSVSRLELALDTPAHEKIGPFWAAVLDREYVTGETGWSPTPASAEHDRDAGVQWADVGDPYKTQPMTYFRRSGSEEPRQRWHPDIWVDPAQVKPRIDAALASGGTLVSDEHAPSFWVLSDPEGNKVSLCTWLPGDTVIG